MKGSVTLLLANQAINSLQNSKIGKQENRLDKEVQESLNNLLLLGVILEGLINEIGSKKVDNQAWEKLEKKPTCLKWQKISKLRKEFEPGKEPLQTISEIQELRNEIAHPKNLYLDNDVCLISDSGQFKINPTDDYELPEENFSIYLGFGNFYKKFNYETSLHYTKKAFDALSEIVELFEMKAEYEWVFTIKKRL